MAAESGTWTDVAQALEERGLLCEVSDLVRRAHCTAYEVFGMEQRTKKVSAARRAAWRLLVEKGFSAGEVATLWRAETSSVQRAVAREEE